MSVKTIKIGSAIPEIIEIDDIAEDFFDFPKPEKVLIVEGITDKEVLDNYLYLKRIKVNFSIRSANMIEGNSYSGKDWALQYYDRNKSNQEIKVLLDRDYDYICSSQREDEGIFYYDYYELENYFFEDKILKSILISNGISIDEIEKIMSFLNDKDTISLHSLLECSKLRIFRKLHKDKATTFQLNDSEIKQFADFIKNIDIRSCFPGRDPNLIGENFTDRLDCYLNNNLNSINSTLYNQIQDFFNSNATDISYPKTLIEYFRYFFKGKDSIKFISDFLLNENLIQSNLNNVSSKNVLRIYIFQSDLYKSKIKEVIRMFST